MMQKLPELMKTGRIAQAEALLDRVLVKLGLENQNKSTPKTSFLKELTPLEVRAEVAALLKEDVPWRKIAWKTCLLDGLRASREQSKPVVLWIFIDRPIDDERC